MSAQINNIRPEFDREIVDIVDYVMNYEISSRVAYDTAHYCLLDTLGCGLEALEYPAFKQRAGLIPVRLSGGLRGVQVNMRLHKRRYN